MNIETWVIEADQIDEAFVATCTTQAVAVAVEGESVIYHKALETIHVLNPPAAVVWWALDGERDIRTIALQLAEAFSIDPQTMIGQVSGIIREFGSQGLLEGVAADAEKIQDMRLDILRGAEGVDEARDD